MSDFIKRTDSVIVDHLAFTVGLSEFRHLERAGGLKGEDRYNWPRLPKQNFNKFKNPYLRLQAVEDYQAEFAHICFERFKAWLDRILNLRLSSSRDRGLHGYTTSYSLLSKNGTAELGLVGFGGNNNTIYVQVSGAGCKHVFSSLRPFVLHFWLCKILTVNKIARCDLAFDDFDGNYDANYALRAYDDDAFKSARGGRNPVLDHRCPRVGSQKQGETVYVGKRTSHVFWRVYDKAAEQGVARLWWRNEVELKKVSVDVLENPALFFAQINRFSNSINLETSPKPVIAKKRAALDFSGKVRWLKRQCGRALVDLIEVFDGDISKAFGAICADSGGRLGIPDTQADILRQLSIEEFNHGIA